MVKDLSQGLRESSFRNIEGIIILQNWEGGCGTVGGLCLKYKLNNNLSNAFKDDRPTIAI